jgi:hypothetical protein
MVLAAAYAMTLLHPGYVFRSGNEGNIDFLSDDEKNML